jgi:hypothetical protein
MSELLKELFVLNPETQMVELNKPWLSTIKEFKVLLRRDKGNSNGKERKKLQAEKEFTFIYHLVDYRSPFADYTESDRLATALENAGYEKNYNFTKDEELLNAVEVYRIMKDTPGLSMLFELKQGLHSSHRVVRKIRQDLNKMLDKLDNYTDEEFEEYSKQLGSKTDPILMISDRMDRIIEITEKLPKTLKAIENLEDSIKKELSDDAGLRGGAEKGAREDGGPSVVPSNPFDEE